MHKIKHELDTRVMAVFLFAAMPFMAFGAFVIVNMAKGELRESVGLALEQRATHTKLALEGYIGELLVHLRLLALDPQIQDLVAEPGPAARKASLVEPAVTARLRQVVQVRPTFRMIQVVGADGVTRASSVRSAGPRQAETAWFEALAADDAPGAFVGDIARTAGFAKAVLEIACPVRGLDGEFRGGVRALVDAADLYGVVGPVRVGRTGHAVLVRRSDGLVLASDETDRVLRDPIPGWPSLQAALEDFPLAERGAALFGPARQRRGYWRIPEVTSRAADRKQVVVEPARLMGFTLVDQIPNVQWLVVVEQQLAEATAPVTRVSGYLWWHFIGVFVVVILLAIYFSLKVEAPVIEEQLHLHEEHLPAGMRPSDAG
jgi:hypothetical protein